ncbi:kinase-like protein, partial [Wolfiporia cocos MD-104 SS10]
LEGLEALHAENIVHRDLKPESVLIGHDGHVVLSDFEHAQLPENSSSISTAQLPVIGHAFQAPELLLGWAHGPAVDWWSFGLILCYML